MNNTIKNEDLENKINELHRLLLGLNAFGSLELLDLKVIESFIKGSFPHLQLKDL